MSDQLNHGEMNYLVSIVRAYLQQIAISSDHQPASLKLTNEILRKLEAGVHAAENQQQQVGSLPAEDFPKQIDVDEARAYDTRGTELVLRHSKSPKLSEHRNMDLSCLLVAMTTGLVQTTGTSREKFCNNGSTNVIYACLKTAFRLGELEDAADKT
jgi:hypothetical protein